jgi:hypothetical protein
VTGTAVVQPTEAACGRDVPCPHGGRGRVNSERPVSTGRENATHGTGVSPMASRAGSIAANRPTFLCVVGGMNQFRRRRRARTHRIGPVLDEIPRAAVRTASNKPDMADTSGEPQSSESQPDRVKPAAPQGVLSHGHAAASCWSLCNQHAAAANRAAFRRAPRSESYAGCASRPARRELAEVPNATDPPGSRKPDSSQPPRCIFCNGLAGELKSGKRRAMPAAEIEAVGNQSRFWSRDREGAGYHG